MADEAALAGRANLLELKLAYERLKDCLFRIKQEAISLKSELIQNQVALAEVALDELKSSTNKKLGVVPFIAGSSVKSGSGLID